MIPTFIRCPLLLLGLLLAIQAQAGVVLNTTRVIYPAADKEVSLAIHNSGSGEILAQSWLESGPDTGANGLPFVITPPLARMDGNARQLLRIIYAGSGLPSDRESVFWLNVQEIPQSAQENALQIAIRQRIKVFFRPRGLTGDPLDAPQTLQWNVIDQGTLEVSNPGAYHVSMIGIKLKQGNVILLDEDSRMLAPRQTARLPIRGRAGNAPMNLQFISINDFGAQVPYRAALSAGQNSRATKAAPTPD